MDSDNVRRGYRIEGRVQGVGFRWWARREGHRLGLNGTVRNRRDGAVEVEVEGPARVVAEYRALLERGPSSARVDRVVETAGGSTPLEGFHIVL